MKHRIFILSLSLAIVSQGFAQGLPDLGESAQADISPATEHKVGEQFMRETRWRDPAYVNDPEIEDYLNQLGGKLVAHSQDVRQEFEFFALRDSTLNAFAWPGGFIGVHTGLIMAAQSESELASVLAHEISHVTQRHIVRMVSKQGQNTLVALAGLVVAILAARNSGQAAEAAVATTQAAAIQSQLSYTRDFEREADRIGLQTLEASGFDVRGMAAFFERLQKYGRTYETNAPSYLRTHPLTTERIADIENRIQNRPYRQVLDSIDFQLVRAKLRSQQGTPNDAVTDFRSQLDARGQGGTRRLAQIAGTTQRAQKGGSTDAPGEAPAQVQLPTQSSDAQADAVMHYGLTRAYLRARNYAAAERELTEVRRFKLDTPMVDVLAGELRAAQNDAAGAAKQYKEGRVHFPASRALLYGQLQALLDAGQPQEALRVTNSELSVRTQDPRLFELQAKAYSALGKRTAQHRSQAELYALQGNLVGAIEQLQNAQKAGDGDFYEQSAVDARLREFKARQAEELKEQRKG